MYKLDFLTVKWALVEKFHDKLYGKKFDAVTDNNRLSYIFTSSKLVKDR